MSVMDLTAEFYLDTLIGLPPKKPFVLLLHGTTWVASLGPDALQEAIFGSSADHRGRCGNHHLV